MNAIVMGMTVGAVCGACFSLIYMWMMGKTAAKEYPVLTLDVPENAEQDFLFRAWCDANRFERQANGVYRKGRGYLTSATEIRFENNQMHIQEIVVFGFVQHRFALNAPIMLGKPIRLHKIKQLNKLIKHWSIEPVAIANEMIVSQRRWTPPQ